MYANWAHGIFASTDNTATNTKFDSKILNLNQSIDGWHNSVQRKRIVVFHLIEIVCVYKTQT